MSTRSNPGPQPSGLTERTIASNRAKNGADFWLAAICTADNPEVTACSVTRLIIADPSPAP